MQQAATSWEEDTGFNCQQLLTNGCGQIFWRQAVIAGLPHPVQDKVRDAPTHLTMDHEDFSLLVAHALDCEIEKSENKRKQMAEVAHALTQLQVREAQGKAKTPQTRTLPQPPPQPQTEEQPPVPQPYTVHAPYNPNSNLGIFYQGQAPPYHSPYQQPFRGGYQSHNRRGGGGRDRNMSRGGPRRGNDTCLQCGHQEHWSRFCPMNTGQNMPQQQMAYPSFVPPLPWSQQQPQQQSQSLQQQLTKAVHQAPNSFMAPSFSPQQ